MDPSGTQEEFDFLASGPASTSGRSDAELLKSALMSERASPEVLQFETDLIARIEQNIDYQVRPRGAPGRLQAPPPAVDSRRPPPPGCHRAPAFSPCRRSK